MTVYTLENLYEGLQLFRQYVESNMPYKQTVYFGEADPTQAPGFVANSGAFYIQINNTTQVVENIYFRKSTLTTTSWELLGSGGGSAQAITLLSAGLTVERTGDDPYNLDIVMTNIDGTELDPSAPLVLPFRNFVDTQTLSSFSLISFENPVNLSIPSAATLEIAQNTPNQKIYVYICINTADSDNRFLAVKAGSRLDDSLITTVYNFGSESYTTNHLYSDLATPTVTAVLRLVGIINVEYNSVSAWGSPTHTISYLPDSDFISDKLLSSPNVGVSLRQQFSEILKPNVTLLDFQNLYNNLAVQTYNEINTTDSFNLGATGSISLSNFLRYQAFFVNPTTSNSILTIPDTTLPKSSIIINTSNVNALYLSYRSETFIIEQKEARHLNFCGSTSPTTPAIKELDNKNIALANYFGLTASVDVGNSQWIFTAKHPLGSDLTLDNYIDVYLNLNTFTPTISSKVAKQRFTSNQVLSVSFNSTLGLDLASTLSQRIYIYIYATTSVYGMCVSGLGKLDEARLYNVTTLSGSSDNKNTLYGSSTVNNVSITCIGYVDYVGSSQTIIGIKSFKSKSVDEILDSFSVPVAPDYFTYIANTDTTLQALEKLQRQTYWLSSAVSQLSEIQDIGLLPVNFNGSLYSISLSETYSVDAGIPQEFGKRYCILDYPSPITVTIDSNSGGFFVAEVVDANITFTNLSSSLILTGGGRKYFLWVARSSDSLGSDPRIRVISEYPPLGYAKNFKSLEPLQTVVNLSVFDAWLLENPSDDINLNLPTNLSQLKNGDKIYMYFKTATTAYDNNYNLNLNGGSIVFYQTVDSTVTISNGGFILRAEFVIISGDPYWMLSTENYDV